MTTTVTSDQILSLAQDLLRELEDSRSADDHSPSTESETASTLHDAATLVGYNFQYNVNSGTATPIRSRCRFQPEHSRHCDIRSAFTCECDCVPIFSEEDWDKVKTWMNVSNTKTWAYTMEKSGLVSTENDLAEWLWQDPYWQSMCDELRDEMTSRKSLLEAIMHVKSTIEDAECWLDDRVCSMSQTLQGDRMILQMGWQPVVKSNMSIQCLGDKLDMIYEVKVATLDESP
jgi:hypothetical protein